MRTECCPWGDLERWSGGVAVSDTVRLGAGVVIHHRDLVNLYGCEIGDETRIGTFVEIQEGARVGARCKISSHSFLCTGVTIEDEVFIGHGVMFTNDLWPRATNDDGSLQGAQDGASSHPGLPACVDRLQRDHPGRRGRGRRRCGRRRRGGDG